MSTNPVIKNTPVSSGDESSDSSYSGSLLNKPVLLGVLVFFIFSFLFSLLIFQRYKLLRDAKQKAAYEMVNQVKVKIQETLAYSISAAKTLSYFIDKDGEVNNFDSISSLILESGKDIDALQLVPGGVISYVYPFKENEKAIGYNILQDETRSKEAYLAIEKEQMYFAGPFELRQGGIGVVGRLPIYRNDSFWGFAAVIIKMPTLFKAAGIDSAGRNGYHFQLSKINPDTKQEEFFLPVHPEKADHHEVSVKVPNGEWKLSVISQSEYNGLGDIAILAILGFILSLIAGISIYKFAIRPNQLNELIKARTDELKNSEIKYRSLIERVSDAFVAIDKDWNYTYVNQRAGEIFDREPESLIGKNIWQEFPEGTDHAFYYAYHRALKTLEYQYLEEYYPPYDKWFENHIYPSNDGLTIFFKDVTEIKKAQIALKMKEEKYRSLIEQASDGIVITNMDGEIIEVNKSIKEMIGFEEAELIGHHIVEFLPEDDMELLPLRITDLMQGKSLLYERRLIKKDGTILDVELNSKMASTHTLIGFIRDITERKKAASELKKSKERFELIAEVTSDVIWDHDFNSNITWGNKNLYALYGAEPESVAISFEMFINQIHPDERAGIKLRLDKAIKNRVSNVVEQFRFKVADGTYRIFTDRSYIKYTDDGQPIRILGAMMDITEREKAQKTILESEEKFRTIVEQASDGIFIADKDTRFTEVNTSGCQITGYTLEELKKMKIVDLIPAEDLEHMPMQITNLKAGESITNERRLKRKDGVVINVEISAKILHDGRYQSIARDISERYEAKELLQKSYEDIRQLASNLQSIREDERTSIAREIHDELGQQLTGLKMDLHWLTRKINSADTEITSKMNESIGLINETIASVRKISTDLRPSILDDLGLIPALEWQGEEFENRSGTKVEFKTNAGDKSVPPKVATAIFRIFQELLTNIARHASASHVKAELIMDEKQIYFTLSDNGVGFDPEMIKNKKTLGLLGIKERSLLLGGTYEFKSALGKGSVTSITIPIAAI